MNKTPANACPQPNELQGYAIGALFDGDALRVSEHLATCHRCGETLDSLRHPSDTILDALQYLDTKVEFLDEPELVHGIDRLRNRAHAAEAPIGPESPDSPSITSQNVDQQADRSTVANGARGRSKQHQIELDRPAQLGPYQIISKLGQGGMGSVYKAIHTHLGKTVAIKVLSSDRFGDRQSTERFKREMKAIGRVQHPNVVVAHDGGQIDNEHFLVMEYVDGVDVSTLDRTHRGLPVSVACEIIRQAAMGLQHAHEMGLIHRDIKPSNLMLDQAGVVKVLDLGLARIESDLSSLSVDRNDETQAGELTAAGTAMGTAGYMSPEQALDSSRVDQRADLYSLGATLYKLLAGTLPFPTEKYDTNGKMLVAIATQEPPSLAAVRADLPIELVHLVDKMLSKEPGDRITTAAEFAERLRPYAGVDLAGLAGCSSGQLPASLQESLLEPTVDDGNAVTPNTKSSLSRIRVIASALVLVSFAFVTAAQVFWLRTEYGTLIVEIADEQVEARLKTDGIAVIDSRSNKVWEIKTGTQDSEQLPKGEYRFAVPAGLLITDDQGLEIDAKEFKLLDAKKQLRIRVSMAPEESTVEPNFTDPHQREIAAAKWVESVGGKMYLSGPGSQELDSSAIARQPGALRFISLSGCGEIPGVGRKLANLPNLEILFARDTSINSDDLTSLLTNKKLFWLQLHRTQLKSADFRRLRDLPRLNSLGLDWSQVNDGWEFLKELPWLPEIDLTTTEPPQFEKLFSHPQLDTVWLDVNFSTSKTSQSELMKLAENALQLNPRLRVAINNKLVGTDPVRTLAEKLANEGWQLSGVNLNWQDPWDSTSEDAWTRESWFHVRNITAPDNLLLNSELLKSLPSLGHAFDTVRFRNATNTELLHAYLRSRVLNHLDLSNSDLDDATLLKIADMSGVKVLSAANTRVTSSGIAKFKKLRPDCEVRGNPPLGAVNVDDGTINLKSGQVHPICETVGDEYELEFTAQRKSESIDAVLVHLKVDGRRAVVLLAGYQGKWSALQTIDGRWGADNETSIALDPFADKLPHRIRIKVTKNSVNTWVDDESIIAWSGDAKRLDFLAPNPGQGGMDGVDVSLFVHPPAEFRISDVKITSDDPNLGANDPYARDREATKWVQSIGGQAFHVDDKLAPDTRLEIVHMHGSGPYTPKDLERFAELPSLRVLKITDSTLDSKGLSPLLTCNRLNQFAVNSTRLTSDDLRRLSQLPRLTQLTISGGQVTDDWDFLGSLRTLRGLVIYSGEVPSLERLGDFPNLRSIILPPSYVPNQAVIDAIQAKNPRLRMVHLNSGQGYTDLGKDPISGAVKELADRGWQVHGDYQGGGGWRSDMPEAWSKEQRFRVIGVNAPKIKEAFLDQRDWELLEFLGFRFSILDLNDTSNLTSLPDFLSGRHIDYLQLVRSSLTDEILVRLADSCLIGNLSISESQVTRAGVEKFKQRQPTCNVFSSFGAYLAEHRLPVADSSSESPIDQPDTLDPVDLN